MIYGSKENNKGCSEEDSSQEAGSKEDCSKASSEKSCG